MSVRRVRHPPGFLGCYWGQNPTTKAAGWFYPPDNGFRLLDGKPIELPLTLPKGEDVDLFGSGFGSFLAPAGTPFAQRAIPPSNLDTYTEAYPYEYHLYEVMQPFTVEAGPAAPWFGQLGGGLQYYTGPVTIPDLVTAKDLLPLN